MLDLAKEVCLPEIDKLVHQEAIIEEDDALYLPPFFHSESGVATKI